MSTRTKKELNFLSSEDYNNIYKFYFDKDFLVGDYLELENHVSLHQLAILQEKIYQTLITIEERLEKCRNLN